MKSEMQAIQGALNADAQGNVQHPDTSQLKTPRHMQGVPNDRSGNAASVSAENAARDKAAATAPKVP